MRTSTVLRCHRRPPSNAYSHAALLLYQFWLYACFSLSHFDADTRLPHLVNVDEDPFRHNRFVYLLKKRVTVFGPQGDVQPMSLR